MKVDSSQFKIKLHFSSAAIGSSMVLWETQHRNLRNMFFYAVPVHPREWRPKKPCATIEKYILVSTRCKPNHFWVNVMKLKIFKGTLVCGKILFLKKLNFLLENCSSQRFPNLLYFEWICLFLRVAPVLQQYWITLVSEDSALRFRPIIPNGKSFDFLLGVPVCIKSQLLTITDPTGGTWIQWSQTQHIAFNSEGWNSKGHSKVHGFLQSRRENLVVALLE